MASSVNFAPENQAFIPAFSKHECAYCRSSIATGQRWVREKIQEPFSANDIRYRRFHADLFGEDVLSCWEKHQLEADKTPATNRPA